MKLAQIGMTLVVTGVSDERVFSAAALGDSDCPISDFSQSDPIGFDKTLQSRKIYIQTSKSTWTSPETDQIPMKGKS
jgi:hypothetical protein